MGLSQRNYQTPRQKPDISRTVEILYVDKSRYRNQPPIIVSNDCFGNNMIDLTQSLDNAYYNEHYS